MRSNCAEPSARRRRRARERESGNSYARDLKLQCAQVTSFTFSIPRTTDTPRPWSKRSCAQRLSSRCDRERESFAQQLRPAFFVFGSLRTPWCGVVCFDFCTSKHGEFVCLNFFCTSKHGEFACLNFYGTSKHGEFACLNLYYTPNQPQSTCSCIRGTPCLKLIKNVHLLCVARLIGIAAPVGSD